MYPQYREPTIGEKIAGIIKICMTVAVVVMVLAIGWVAVGGFFSGTNGSKGGLPAAAQAVYANIITGTSSALLLFLVLPVALIVAYAFFAIFGATGGKEEY